MPAKTGPSLEVKKMIGVPTKNKIKTTAKRIVIFSPKTGQNLFMPAARPSLKLPFLFPTWAGVLFTNAAWDTVDNQTRKPAIANMTKPMIKTMIKDAASSLATPIRLENVCPLKSPVSLKLSQPENAPFPISPFKPLIKSSYCPPLPSRAAKKPKNQRYLLRQVIFKAWLKRFLYRDI